jgi:hypothetical protein
MTVGNEIVYRVAKTPKGYKVKRLDGTGLADGVMTKKRSRYFYADDYSDPEQAAHDYAKRKAEETDRPSRVVPLGERI